MKYILYPFFFIHDLLMRIACFVLGNHMYQLTVKRDGMRLYSCRNCGMIACFIDVPDGTIVTGRRGSKWEIGK